MTRTIFTSLFFTTIGFPDRFPRQVPLHLLIGEAEGFEIRSPEGPSVHSIFERIFPLTWRTTSTDDRSSFCRIVARPRLLDQSAQVAELLPELLCQMGSKRSKQENKRFKELTRR